MTHRMIKRERVHEPAESTPSQQQIKEFELLVECFKSGQVSPPQMLKHMSDSALLKAYVLRKIEDES